MARSSLDISAILSSASCKSSPAFLAPRAPDDLSSAARSFMTARSSAEKPSYDFSWPCPFLCSIILRGVESRETSSANTSPFVIESSAVRSDA